MTFANPQYLILLVALPMAVAVALLAAHMRRRALSRIGDPALVGRLTGNSSAARRIARHALTIAALGLAILAIARPQWGETEQIVERHGVQLMVALDVSRSMLAEDVSPNRLERAKLEVADMLQRLHGDEVGLTLFAGAAFIQFPLTFDYATARTFLDNAEPQMIGRQGTAIAEAIDVSMRGLDNDRVGHKAIVIISDGEDDQESSDAIAAARRAANAGLSVYTMGVGTATGEPIPMRDRWDNLLGYQEDADGNMVLTRVDEDTLRGVAEAGGGAFVMAGGANRAGATIAEELDSLEKSIVESEISSAKVERFQWFAALAVLLLALGRAIPERGGGRRFR